VKGNGQWAMAAAIACMALLGGDSSSFRSIQPCAGLDAVKRLPQVILWAWERREDLSFLDPRKTGVAYLAGTLRLSGDQIVVRMRRQPLIVPRNTVVIPVVRIETDADAPPTLSARQRTAACKAIVRLAGSRPAAIQIDFDATRSQRAFYRALLSDLRARVRASVPLSMTALASWCIYDDWITNLPVNEAVPMLFRMGADSQEISAYLGRGGHFVPEVCRTSVGAATDEPLAAIPGGRRVYVFSPRAWTRAQATRAIAEYSK
jgi:Protein of unknown function (DUF3142)